MSKTNISFLVLVIPVCRQAGRHCNLEFISSCLAFQRVDLGSRPALSVISGTISSHSTAMM
jgi:hypothetical protein